MYVYVSADNLAWDPDYMGSSMMVPVVYVTWFMTVVFCSLLGEHITQLPPMHLKLDSLCRAMLCAANACCPCTHNCICHSCCQYLWLPWQCSSQECVSHTICLVSHLFPVAV